MTNLTTLASQIHADNRAKGFWDEPRSLCETTMLIVTELAEAVEEERAGRDGVWFGDRDGEAVPNGLIAFDDSTGLAHCTLDLAHTAAAYDAPPALKPEGIDIELVDALIRLLDLLGSREVDVDELLKIKRGFNASRPARHGKAY